MRVGIVCPYSLDVPGGVQNHVLDLAGALRARGHTAEVLAPAVGTVPEFVTPVGRALGVPYNGSVARVSFGPRTHRRARRWLAEHDFDVLHLHEPTTLSVSVSVLALLLAGGPIVATFHTSTERSRALAAFGGIVRPLMEKVTARIAVSATARRVQVEHLGGDATEIPNGVDIARFAGGPALDELVPGLRPGVRVGFVGRYDEPRKGMPVLLDALRPLVAARPDLRLLVVGRGDAGALRHAAGPALAGRIDVLGAVDETTKAAALRAMDLYCAPHRHGESFGMVLTEAMAAGVPVLASDIESFRAVHGGAGRSVPPADPIALRAALAALLDDGADRAAMAAAGRARVARYDWAVVARDVLQVYRAAIAAAPVPARRQAR
ncbi:glycosyltransferase family 4 protein [Pseudonocardia sp. HH130630-07]|uniref:glycosyltransferase family 4 protein n=1 Tax=Pseudonocardia sp. HH130630-07 TaxID=1690815 RepID=UPI0008153CF0|nr:glycosyltransferase family 4 protein [Pseudonocardia sp. HH130630-07]ANY09561.1 alpha-(1-2)-phosphatidylinositol mannosyltransferase [Pseudonocardia sp. HH130630-07]